MNLALIFRLQWGIFFGNLQKYQHKKPLEDNNTGNCGSFVGANIFIGTDGYNSNYIRRDPKPTNIVYMHRFGPATNEYRARPV
jgi:hypothetical protein